MDVAADDAREGAVEARVRHALPDNAVIGDAIAVGADQRVRRAHDGADVVLRDRGDQHAGRAVIRDQHLADAGRSGRPAARRRAPPRCWPAVSGSCGEIDTCTASHDGDAAPVVEPVIGDLRFDAGARFRLRRGAPASPRCRRPAPRAAAGFSAGWRRRHRGRRRNRCRNPGRAPRRCAGGSRRPCPNCRAPSISDGRSRHGSDRRGRPRSPRRPRPAPCSTSSRTWVK